jgi:hypothetical protein
MYYNFGRKGNSAFIDKDNRLGFDTPFFVEAGASYKDGLFFFEEEKESFFLPTGVAVEVDGVAVTNTEYSAYYTKKDLVKFLKAPTVLYNGRLVAGKTLNLTDFITPAFDFSLKTPVYWGNSLFPDVFNELLNTPIFEIQFQKTKYTNMSFLLSKIYVLKAATQYKLFIFP